MGGSKLGYRAWKSMGSLLGLCEPSATHTASPETVKARSESRKALKPLNPLKPKKP